MSSSGDNDKVNGNNDDEDEQQTKENELQTYQVVLTFESGMCNRGNRPKVQTDCFSWYFAHSVYLTLFVCGGIEGFGGEECSLIILINPLFKKEFVL